MTDLDTFLDALETTAGAHSFKVITAAELAVMIREARAKLDTEQEEPATPEHWSPWLDWHGGPCPLPPCTMIDCKFLDGGRSAYARPAGQCEWSHSVGNVSIVRFRYLADNPSGWLPRGDWIPPAELWRDDCPVRCEWRAAVAVGVQSAGSCQPRNWHTITHIRLVARNLEEATQTEPAAVPGLPEWARGPDRKLYELALQSGNVVYLSAEDIAQIGELRDILAARRRAGL